MVTRDAIHKMMESSAMSAYQVSLAMGRAHSYMDATLRRGGDVSASVLASIATACGYRLVLTPSASGRSVIEIDGRRADD